MSYLTPWVHQYSLRDLLDDTFDLLKARMVTLLLAGVIPFVPVLVFAAFMRNYVFPQELMFNGNPSDPFAFFQSAAFWQYYLVWLLLLSLAMLVGSLAQCRIALDQALGRDATLWNGFRWLFKPFWGALVLVIIYSLLSGVANVIAASVLMVVFALFSGLGAIFIQVEQEALAAVSFAIGGVIMVLGILFVQFLIMVFFLAAWPVLVFERTGPFTAMSKSFRYVSKNFKAIFGAFYALVHIPQCLAPFAIGVALLLYALFQHVSPMLANALLIIFSNGPVIIVTTAILACLQALVYLDGRSRTEAFDLLLLAHDVGMGNEIAVLLKEKERRMPLPASAPMYPDYTQTPAALTPGAADTKIPPIISTMTAPYPDYSAPPPPLEVETPADSAAETVPAEPEPLAAPSATSEVAHEE